MINLFSPKSLEVSIRDLLGIKNDVGTNEEHIVSALEWLKYAQDQAGDGGVAAWYSLANGWSPSYVETTGYIISTFLECAEYFKDKNLEKRAKKMADFLVSMQLPEGGFRSEVPKRNLNSKPVVFDTGQDIIGLTDIYQINKNRKYLDSAVKAADFLCSIQESDGSWIKYEYGGKPRAYETRTAWALLKVYQITKKRKYKEYALKNLKWAAKRQLKNGWFLDNDFPFPNPSVPYTHTISYVAEGFLWSGIILKTSEYIAIAKKAVDPLLNYYLKNDFLAGTFDKNWNSQDKYTCLTGDAQLSLVWLMLYQISKDHLYLTSAHKMNNFLKTVQDIRTKNKNLQGAIKGSLPIYGDLIKRRGYCRMAYPNWAAKFFIDALLAESKITQGKTT